jgi:chemotaxis family two-component system sensor kinase Cph1
VKPLDMSMCYLRSMSPLHLQYLRNMGVTGTLVVSLVREGKLWGLIACHHYSPRNLRYALRAACDLLAEVVSTRIAAIENYAHAQVAMLVRRLEQRLIEATSTEGDWRLALFRNPRTLLQPLEATGAALFHDGEVLTCGEVPSTPELRALCTLGRRAGWADPRWPAHRSARPPGAGSASRPPPAACWRSSCPTTRPDYLMWFRKEQLLTVTWAGDPTKPMVDNDPLQLSPRRSFAAWSEIVRGTALPWTSAELAMAAPSAGAGRHHRAGARGAAAHCRTPARDRRRSGGRRLPCQRCLLPDGRS